MRLAKELLLRYPLCDKCLGRFFAHYGVGLSNEERGRAVKTLLAMEIHREVLKSFTSVTEELKRLAENAGYPLNILYKSITGREVNVKKCYVCNNELRELIPYLISKALDLLNNVSIRSFVMAVKSGSIIELRERSIAEELGIESWESIRRELKREIGKAIQRLRGLRAEFRDPDAILLIDLDRKDVELMLLPLYLRGRYFKLGRFISQMIWISRDGSKKYKLSIEEVCRNISKIVGGTDVKIHAAGREDVDVRMLGNGRPLIVEVKEPKMKDLNITTLSNLLNTNPLIKISIERIAKPSEVTRVKEEVHQKVYGALVYSSDGFTSDDVIKIVNTFRNIDIKQLTPKRVLRRRKEMLRVKKVYEVDGVLLNKYLAYYVIKCDGGLYVKELINGDDGRTQPSFSSITGKKMDVLFLDVLKYLES